MSLKVSVKPEMKTFKAAYAACVARALYTEDELADGLFTVDNRKTKSKKNSLNNDRRFKVLKGFN